MALLAVLQMGFQMSSIRNQRLKMFGSQSDESRLGLIAVTLSIACWVCLSVVESIFFLALLIKGDEGISDNWVGYMTAYTLLGSLAVTFITFVTALVLRRRHDRLPLLWIALYGFPVLVVATFLIELFIIE